MTFLTCKQCGKRFRFRTITWSMPRTYCSRECSTKHFNDDYAKLQRRMEERKKYADESLALKTL